MTNKKEKQELGHKDSHMEVSHDSGLSLNSPQLPGSSIREFVNEYDDAEGQLEPLEPFLVTSVRLSPLWGTHGCNIWAVRVNYLASEGQALIG